MACLMVSMLRKHVMPSLYPAMVQPANDGMGRGQYAAFFNDLLKAVKGFFAQSSQSGRPR